MIESRHWLLLVLGGFVGCAPNGSSSTGVGNPSVISLSLVTDDESDLSPQAGAGATSNQCAAGGASSGGVAATAGEPADGSNAGASGESSSAGAPSESSNAGAPSESSSAGAPSESSAGAPSAGAPAVVVDDDELPRRSVHHAVIVIGEFEWLPCDETLDHPVVKGPFIVNLVGDLVAQGTQPAIPHVTEPPGGFCGIDAPLVPASAPAELAGRSVFFDGTRPDGTPFVLYADVTATLRVRRHGSIVWDATDTPNVLWAFRPRHWLSRMALDQVSATSASDRTISIDLNRYPLLLDALRHRLAGKSSLFLDVNDNRMLDAEDRNALVGDGLDDPD